MKLMLIYVKAATKGVKRQGANTQMVNSHGI